MPTPKEKSGEKKTSPMSVDDFREGPGKPESIETDDTALEKDEWHKIKSPRSPNNPRPPIVNVGGKASPDARDSKKSSSANFVSVFFFLLIVLLAGLVAQCRTEIRVLQSTVAVLQLRIETRPAVDATQKLSRHDETPPNKPVEFEPDETPPKKPVEFEPAASSWTAQLSSLAADITRLKVEMVDVQKEAVEQRYWQETYHVLPPLSSPNSFKSLSNKPREPEPAALSGKAHFASLEADVAGLKAAMVDVKEEAAEQRYWQETLHVLPPLSSPNSGRRTSPPMPREGRAS